MYLKTDAVAKAQVQGFDSLMMMMMMMMMVMMMMMTMMMMEVGETQKLLGRPYR